MLVDEPRLLGEGETRIDQRCDTGNKEDDVEREVEAGLHPRPHRAVKKVAADVRVLRQTIGAAEHEQRAVQHVVGVEDPSRRRVQDIALEHFDADDGHQNDDQPGEGLANPRADAIDRVQKALNVHSMGQKRQKWKSNTTKHHSVARPEWCFASSVSRQIGFLAFGPK
jgi:hypothetical protein